MRKRRLQWYVFGGQAAVAYGRPRMTADVDITVEPGRFDPLALLGELERAQFDLRIDLDDAFLRQARLLPLVHRPTAMPVDVVIASSSLHAEFLARRRLVDIEGVRIPMISPEDLVVTKVLAGRRKDLEDLRGVLLEQGSLLDLEYIRALLSDLESALQNERLLPRFERIVRATSALTGRRVR